MKSGQLIKNQREKIGLAQQEVASALGYSSIQFVSNLERGLAVVPMKQVFKLSKVLKINSEELKEAIIADVVEQMNREYLKAGGK